MGLLLDSLKKIKIDFFLGKILPIRKGPNKPVKINCRFGRISPKSANFWLDIGRNSPKSKEIRPQILGRNLTARIRPFSGEQELLCTFQKFLKHMKTLLVSIG
jgi:hypothetical protein